MRKFFMAAMLLLVATVSAQKPYSQRMAESQGRQWTHGKGWDYVNGLVSKSLLKTCEQYDGQPWTDSLYAWSKEYADRAINTDGTFKDFRKGNIDNIASGKVLFELSRREQKLHGKAAGQRYEVAAKWLRDYLVNDYSRIQLTDGKGGFFHKDIYPNQMWLDGLYMGAAFYAEWQANNAPNDMKAWSDIASQFITIHRHTYNAQKQLNYHAWAAVPTDVNAFWANKTAPYLGCSKEFWGRGMGWFFAALVDVLEYMPKSHPDYAKLEAITSQVAAGLARWQDKKSGTWYQLLQYDDSFAGKCGVKNYLESSASSMFTYAYLKGVRIGVLPKKYRKVGEKAYKGLIKTFVTENEDGTLNLIQTCRSAGLGPAKSPGRDGSASYYLCGSDVRMVQNEGKAIGPFIMASLEYERK